MRNNYLEFKISGDLIAAILILMELKTGDTYVIEFFVAVMVTGGLFYSFFVAVMNKLFKNDQSWRFK